MVAYRILLIEDDPAIGQSLLDGLRAHGFEPYLRATGGSGVDFAKQNSPHLILLDIRLPDGSGFDFCRQMRQAGVIQPIIMLTVQQEELDKVLGLEMGADERHGGFSIEIERDSKNGAKRRVAVTCDLLGAGTGWSVGRSSAGLGANMYRSII